MEFDHDVKTIGYLFPTWIKVPEKKKHISDHQYVRESYRIIGFPTAILTFLQGHTHRYLGFFWHRDVSPGHWALYTQQRFAAAVPAPGLWQIYWHTAWFTLLLHWTSGIDDNSFVGCLSKYRHEKNWDIFRVTCFCVLADIHSGSYIIKCFLA